MLSKKCFKKMTSFNRTGLARTLHSGILLVHRDLRDGEACKEKYGKDWDKYTALVPYRLVPYLY